MSFKGKKFGRGRAKPFKRTFRRTNLDSEKVKNMELDESMQHFEAEVIDVVVTNSLFLALHDPETKTITLVRVPFSRKWSNVPKWSVLGRLMLRYSAKTVGDLKGKKVIVVKTDYGRLTVI